MSIFDQRNQKVGHQSTNEDIKVPYTDKQIHILSELLHEAMLAVAQGAGVTYVPWNTLPKPAQDVRRAQARWLLEHGVRVDE